MTDTSDPKIDKPATRRKRLRRAGLWSLGMMLALVILGAGGVVYMLGRPVTAPTWVQDRIEARLATALPTVRIEFGDVMFVIDKGWYPRVRLRDVAVKSLEGIELVGFSQVQTSLSMAALMRRQLQPRSIALTGVFATLRRDIHGRVALSGGVGIAPPAREAATLPGLIKELDRVLELPALSALRLVELRALTLTYVDQRAERRWTADGGRLILTRKDNALDLAADLAVLGGGAGVTLLTASYQSSIGAQAAEFGVTFDGVPAKDIAAQGPVFAWLDVLRAPISGTVQSGIGADGQLTPLNATLQIGAGVVQPNDGTKPIPFQAARSDFSYDAAQNLLRFDELSVRSKWVTGRAEGQAIIGEKDGKLNDLVAQFRLSNVTANPRDVYATPAMIDAAELDVQVRLNPFRLRLGRLVVSDQGRTLRASGQLDATPAGWKLGIDGVLDAISRARLLALWPETLKRKTRKWVVENLIDGALSDLQLAFRISPDHPPRSLASFEFSDATVRFLKSMPPLTQGRGHAVLQDKRFVVALDSGVVAAPEGGAVKLAGTSFIIPDTSVKGGAPAIARLRTDSSLTAVLSLLNQPPLSVLDRVGLPVTLAEGQAALTGRLSFPLAKGTKPRDVTYDVSGALRALETDTLVKGRSLRAQEMTLAADNSAISISGKGRIDGVPFDGRWSQPIGKGSRNSRVNGTVAITQAALDAFNIALPSGMVTGEGRGDLMLDLEKGKPPAFALQSDLRGLRLSVPQVGWSKPAEVLGKLAVSGRLGNTPTVESLVVEGPGLSTRGSITLNPSGTLDRVRFDQLKVGAWLDMPVDLVGQGADRAPQVVVRGGTLDMRRAKFGSGPPASGPPAPPMQLRLDRLQVTDTVALTNLQGSFKTGQGLDGAFQALLNNAVPVTGRVLPQNGRSAIRLQSNDAGAVVRAAGVMKQAVGGTLSLTLLPVGAGGAFDGRLEIERTRIKDAPAIAALLNALSVVGLMEQMNGEGIYFDKVEADFRLTSNRLTLTRASAVGASMGISMDGVFAPDTGTIAMQGVVSPAYFLNGIGAVLTRKGEGLVGFNYTLSGNAKAPDVSVNPLSVLTPGMFRDIFRAPPPKLPTVDGVTGTTLPQALPPAEKPVVNLNEGR